MNESLLIRLEHFFEADIKIKKEMYNTVPPSDKDYLDENSIVKYTNKLDSMLIYVFSELKHIALDVYGSDSQTLSVIKKMESEIKRRFYSCGLNINNLRAFYNTNISNMNEEFIDKVKNSCVGYALKTDYPLDSVTSINEILHLMHADIMNNEHVLQAVPVISEKNNSFNYPISLRGNKSELFQKLYDSFPLDLDVGWTDMVCLNDRHLLMMIRDRGHATSIEITIENNKARVEYFIPKLCNIDMINALPGVNKVKENSAGATGVFETEIDSLPDALYSFISKIPMDKDMVYDWPHR